MDKEKHEFSYIPDILKILERQVSETDYIPEDLFSTIGNALAFLHQRNKELVEENGILKSKYEGLKSIIRYCNEYKLPLDGIIVDND